MLTGHEPKCPVVSLAAYAGSKKEADRLGVETKCGTAESGTERAANHQRAPEGRLLSNGIGRQLFRCRLYRAVDRCIGIQHARRIDQGRARIEGNGDAERL